MKYNGIMGLNCAAKRAVSINKLGPFAPSIIEFKNTKCIMGRDKECTRPAKQLILAGESLPRFRLCEDSSSGF